MKIFSKLYYEYRKILKIIILYLVISGPGIVVMVADNDAAGITTYAATGAKFGYNLIWFLLLLVPIAYFVQEMTVRLGVITKRGHAESVFEAFGKNWGWFSLTNLMLVNWLTLITEFVGMAAALSLFGVPPYATVAGVCTVMGFMVLNGRYWTWEKIALTFCALNLIYIPCAFLVNPPVSAIIHEGFIPNLPGGFSHSLFFFLMANIGTTIAPWMLYFQQSAVIDKGMKEKDIPWAKFDTMVGAVLTIAVAIFIVIVAGTVLKGAEFESAAQAAEKLMSMNKYVGSFLAIGLFNAGLLGAICISLASSWAFGEIFGWAHSLNNKIKEAPWFYANYFITLISAGLIILIPKAPLVLITLLVQVVSAMLLPPTLIFLLLMLNDKKSMGEYKNNLLQNIIGISIVTLIIILSTLYAVSIIFPNLFN